MHDKQLAELNVEIRTQLKETTLRLGYKDQLMLLWENCVAYFQNYTKHKITICEKIQS
jgi:hypothetical protein